MWAALIEPGQLDQWAPFVAGRALDVTGPVTLTHIDGDEVDDLPGAVLQVTADGIAPLASQADTPTNPVESPNTDR